MKRRRRHNANSWIPRLEAPRPSPYASWRRWVFRLVHLRGGAAAPERGWAFQDPYETSTRT